ncbi:MAG TPA: GNAT family N-acetyltransferase [Gemmatimonadaceae bacterium]|nr:GNAT family N-acetyltransferase [Gemmatimonadaceae bacterium]
MEGSSTPILSDEKGSWRIVTYQPDNALHRDAFRNLNFAWIEQYFFVEEADRRYLEHPDVILADGGQIFIAEGLGSEAGRILGACALLVHEPRTFELSKMGVAPEAKNRGIGNALGRVVIDEARKRGASEIELLSNTILEPAIRLYRRLGFREVPLEGSDYERANIKMVLQL